jgi:hypothetical protein
LWNIDFSVVRLKSKTSPKNGQPRIVQNGFPNFRAIFCAIRLRHSMLLHLPEKYPEYYSKHPPKMATQELRKMAFQGFQPCFIFYLAKSNPLHNAVIGDKQITYPQTIKVRPRKWRKRTLKND